MNLDSFKEKWTSFILAEPVHDSALVHFFILDVKELLKSLETEA